MKSCFSKIALAATLFLPFAAPLLCAAQRAEAAPLAEAFTASSDVAYTQGAIGALKADVYIPLGDGPFPGVVFIHGGGWKNGDRNQMIKLIKAVAEDGYVCMTIEYDVDPVHFPASFHESLDAVRFFRAHAVEYRLDPHHVAVAGSSAGGELAALVALNPSAAPLGKAAAKNTPAPEPVQAALIFNGALDLTAQDESRSTSVEDYLGGKCSVLTEVCRDASPLFHVHAGAPPFYVGHGTTDQAVPFAEAVAFTGALQKAGVPVQFFQAEGGKHTYWADPRFYATNLANIKAFLSANLKGGKH
jgi:acetyl esterase/lipase